MEVASIPPPTRDFSKSYRCNHITITCLVLAVILITIASLMVTKVAFRRYPFGGAIANFAIGGALLIFPCVDIVCYIRYWLNEKKKEKFHPFELATRNADEFIQSRFPKVFEKAWIHMRVESNDKPIQGYEISQCPTLESCKIGIEQALKQCVIEPGNVSISYLVIIKESSNQFHGAIDTLHSYINKEGNYLHSEMIPFVTLGNKTKEEIADVFQHIFDVKTQILAHF